MMIKGEINIANIALISQRMLGHIIPSMGLGMELIRNGHKVFFLANKIHESLITNAGIQYVEIGWDKFPDRFIKEFMNELIQKLEISKIDLVICDSAQAAAAFAAEKKEIPWVSFQTTVPLPDRFIPGKKHVTQRLRNLYGQKLDQIRNSFEMKPLKDFTRTRGDLVGLSPYLHMIMVEEHLVTQIEDLPSNTEIVGFCSYKSESEEHIVDLNITANTTLLVCTTSLTRPEYIEITNNYIDAVFEALGDCESFNIIISAQSKYYGRKALKGNIRWLHQFPIHDSLMPLVNFVISHGGASTIQRMMRYGKPGIIIPLGEDQPAMAKRFSEIGSTIVLNPSEVNSQSIKNSISALLNDKEFHVHAQNFADSLTDTNPNKKAANAVELLLNKF
jgi:UDP:flavonoid glycosyltransferase YjiC (YdhE family)